MKDREREKEVNGKVVFVACVFDVTARSKLSFGSPLVAPLTSD